jgi:hypothetical protein
MNSLQTPRNFKQIEVTDRNRNDNIKNDNSDDQDTRSDSWLEQTKI